ncbi:MAG: nucleotidyltransferase, partial [Clostridiales bacterium]|nr:nucleotidyltransferase [Clostridiales bacterium]
MSFTTLVIMAAGMGSRYGGIKQLEPVGPKGEIIMDYSIYDAISAGFNKVVIIIRKDLENDFKEVIGNRIEKQIKVEYVFQESDALPDGFHTQAGRTKPWGTGHAVYCCKDLVNEPFAVINADDYYGKEAFKLIYDYLNSDAHNPYIYCMAGFVLGNTLSENGAVTRGVCKTDDDGWLVDIVETSGIIKDGNHAKAKSAEGSDFVIDLDSSVSMNMW